MNSTPCHDWIPIDQVTPENCPDGSTVQIRWDDQTASEPAFYSAIIRWVNGEAVLKTKNDWTYNAPDAVLPCTK
jgi:hypothetical protein